MSDLGLVRYLGYAELPEAAAADGGGSSASSRSISANGVHLIVVQSADGSLVVGDSHHYGGDARSVRPEARRRAHPRRVPAVADLPEPRVSERWTGTYASAPDRLMLVDRPADARAHRHDHQRHRRQHLLRHRRRGHRRPVRQRVTSGDSHVQHLKAVVFDWAGTMVDHGSLAPMGVFVEVFSEFRRADHD